ncbi:MAG TPA: YbgA family protein, partial [Nitrospiria bacterium]
NKNPRSKTAGYSEEKLNPQIPLYPPFLKGEPKRSPRSELRGIASLNSAHSDPHLRRLGRLLWRSKSLKLSEVYQEYGYFFMEALSIPATIRKHINVLQHMLGYFSDRLTSLERMELVEVIEDFRKGFVPLVVPITLIVHYVRKYQIDYLMEQVYLQPHPKELMLRNHV